MAPREGAWLPAPPDGVAIRAMAGEEHDAYQSRTKTIAMIPNTFTQRGVPR
jgi:hypothetical protein